MLQKCRIELVISTFSYLLTPLSRRLTAVGERSSDAAVGIRTKTTER